MNNEYWTWKYFECWRGRREQYFALSLFILESLFLLQFSGANVQIFAGRRRQSRRWRWDSLHACEHDAVSIINGDWLAVRYHARQAFAQCSIWRSRSEICKCSYGTRCTLLLATHGVGYIVLGTTCGLNWTQSSRSTYEGSIILCTVQRSQPSCCSEFQMSFLSSSEYPRSLSTTIFRSSATYSI